MSKPWGAVGAWALDAEREEAEQRALAAADPPPPPLLAGQPPQSFPSLRDAAATKTKKKKPTPIPLAQFVAPEPQRLSQAEILCLPTGPRERSTVELQSTLGFRGGGGGGSRGFDDEQRSRPLTRVSDLVQPSKADEVANWADSKKSFTPMRRDRYAELGNGSSSRADEVDDWTKGKKLLPARNLGLGSHPASDSDRWVSGERRRLVLDPPKRNEAAMESGTAVWTRPSVFGAARPREEVLKEKGVDPSKIDAEIKARKTSRPMSSDSSRLGSGGPEAGGGKSRPKVNPFGEAKPREVLLQEKGIDWRKLDLELEHRRVDRPQTEEEKLLKAENNQLKAMLKEMEGNLKNESAQVSDEDLASLRKLIVCKETVLEQLTCRLDDIVRFGQSNSRPGSGGGRSGMYSDRPSSQSGRSEELRDRSRSRGSIGEGRTRERVFLTDRNLERPGSCGSLGEGLLMEKDFLNDRNMNMLRSGGIIGEGWARERAFLNDRNMKMPGYPMGAQVKAGQGIF